MPLRAACSVPRLGYVSCEAFPANKSCRVLQMFAARARADKSFPTSPTPAACGLPAHTSLVCPRSTYQRAGTGGRGLLRVKYPSLSCCSTCVLQAELRKLIEGTRKINELQAGILSHACDSGKGIIHRFICLAACIQSAGKCLASAQCFVQLDCSPPQSQLRRCISPAACVRSAGGVLTPAAGQESPKTAARLLELGHLTPRTQRPLSGNRR